MKAINALKYLTALSVVLLLVNCSEEEPEIPIVPDPVDSVEVEFHFGVDLSYVNQILDKGGVFMEANAVKDPYKIFAEQGSNIARFRLWHNPTWTMEVYGDEGTQMYNDLEDVTLAISRAKAEGMKILLDFHYADSWADPGKQPIPAAWQDITSIGVLSDSVYQYTLKTLQSLSGQGLMPEYVQLGNETNCGMLYTDKPADFPNCNVCEDGWVDYGRVINRAIQAVNDVSTDTKIMLHVADPVNVDWWFTNIESQASITAYDIIGFSYYPLWHTGVGFSQLEQRVSSFKTKFNKDIMILETAYPWTTEWNDDYGNLFGGQDPVSGYPYTPEGQTALMTDMTQSLIDAGAIGIFYWEPAWITSDLRTQWGTGSAWENNAFFDFDGNVNHGFDFMQADYGLDTE